MKNNCAVIICSCDAYQDVWDPFFRLMDKYWKDIPYRVYLNTETIEFNKNYENFSVEPLLLPDDMKKGKITWSQRMLSVLDRIEEEYVLILIEDFFLRERVQTELIEEIIEQMDRDPLMCQVQLFGTRTNCDNERQNIISENIEMEEIVSGKAKVVFVPTIWRKETMKKWLRSHESIWAFEACGSKRAYRWKYKEKVYRVYSPAIFNYLWEKGCYCVVNGKWMLHPLLTSLFDENDIHVDFSERGTITMEEWNNVTMNTLIKRNGIIGTARKILSRIRSFI